MTIVAGFQFDNGIMICADTKHIGSAVQDATKLHQREYRSGVKSVFGFAGRSRLARMAIRNIESAIDALDNPTRQEMEYAVEAVILDIHKKHIFPHPERGLLGGPNFNLIFALWSPHGSSELGLYSTEETALDEIKRYDCIGTGDYLGKYIIEPRIGSGNASLGHIIFTAITALSRIKRYDPECGGRSEFVVVKKNGELSVESDFDITQGEKFSDTFFNHATALYSKIAETQLTEEETKKEINQFVEIINQVRSKLQTEKDARNTLIAALSKRLMPLDTQTSADQR